MPWYLSPSGWPQYATEGSLLAASLEAKGYDVLEETDVPAAIAAYLAGNPLPPPSTDYVTQAELTAALAAFVPSAPADATTGSKGILALAGDLAGTADEPTVPGLADKVSTTAVGAASGVASLGSDGKLTAGQRPTLTADNLTDATVLGRALVRAASEADARALTGAGTSNLTLDQIVDANLFASQLDLDNAASSLFGRTAVADLARTNDTQTLDPELQFEALAGELLQIDMRLAMNLAVGGGTGTGFAAKWQLPGASTGLWARESTWSQPGPATSSTGLLTDATTELLFRMEEGNRGIRATALIEVAADGVVGLMWGQDVTNAAALTRLALSNLLIRRLNPP